MNTRLPILLLLILALTIPCHADDRDDEIRQLKAQLRLLRAQVKSLQETVKAQATLIAKLKAGEILDEPQPTSRPLVETNAPPTAKPKRFRNIREIISKVPTKIHPKSGDNWDDLRETQFDEWAETYTTDGIIELTLVIKHWDQNTTRDGDTEFRLGFEELIACRVRGIKYRVDLSATFLADQIDKLLKRKPGDEIKVVGRIKNFEMTSSWTEREDLFNRRGGFKRDSDGNIRQRVVARWARLDIELVNASIK